MSFHDEMQAAWDTAWPRYEEHPPGHVERELVIRGLDGKKHRIQVEDQAGLEEAIRDLRPIWIRAKALHEGRFHELPLRFPSPERAVLCLRILRDDLGIHTPDVRLIRQGGVYWILAAGILQGIKRIEAERVLDLLDGRSLPIDARHDAYPCPHRATTLDAAWYPLPGSWNLLEGQCVEEIDLRRRT